MAPSHDLLRFTLDRPIAFHRIFAKIGGSVTVGLFLSQAWYWSQRTTNPDGWFYKTQDEWEDETALSRREQEQSRKRLMSLGILEEDRRGMPAQLFYRLNVAAIEQAILGIMPSLTLAQILDVDGPALGQFSKAALMRARKESTTATYVDYTDVLSVHGLTCGHCTAPIPTGLGPNPECLTFAYITPLESGGEHVATNIIPTHVQCHPPESEIPVSHCNSQSAYRKQTSLLTVNKQDCLPQTNKSAYRKQTFLTETTTETTTEKKDPPMSPPEGDALPLEMLPVENGWATPETFVALYNTLIPEGHPRATLTSGRRKKIQQYLAEFPDRDYWATVFGAIAQCPFLRGEVSRPDHPAVKRNLDWFLQRGKDGIENCQKTFEGKYRDQTPCSSSEDTLLALYSLDAINARLTTQQRTSYAPGHHGRSPYATGPSGSASTVFAAGRHEDPVHRNAV